MIDNPLEEVWGKWPGDESIEEILETLNGNSILEFGQEYYVLNSIPETIVGFNGDMVQTVDQEGTMSSRSKMLVEEYIKHGVWVLRNDKADKEDDEIECLGVGLDFKGKDVDFSIVTADGESTITIMCGWLTLDLVLANEQVAEMERLLFCRKS